MNLTLIQFYLGIGTDSEDRFLQDILAWQSMKEWEGSHTFIQWVFPLPEPSRFNPDAPLLDAETLEVFKASQACMKHAAKAYIFAQRFLWQKGVTWMQPMDHNHLRITRIIRFFNLIGYTHAAKHIYLNVTQIARRDPKAVSEDTLEYWRQALLPIE